MIDTSSSAVAAAIADQKMINLWSFAFVFLVALLGALCHWTKKKVRGEIAGSLVDYLFFDKPYNSAASAGIIFTGALAAAGTGVADVIDPRLLWALIWETGTMPAVTFFAIGAAWQAGWQVDSMVNTGKLVGSKA